MYICLYLLQLKVSEIDFRQWYKSKEELRADEDRDHYPPRFKTHLKCCQPSTLHVTYILKAVKDSTAVENIYTFSIFAKGSREGETV